MPRRGGRTGRFGSARVARFATRLSACPPAASAEDVQALRNAGLSDGEIFDLILAIAMFSWANRLMHPLGEPVAVAEG